MLAIISEKLATSRSAPYLFKVVIELSITHLIGTLVHYRSNRSISYYTKDYMLFCHIKKDSISRAVLFVILRNPVVDCFYLFR